MPEYTKYINVMQYTETVYLKDGEEIARERNWDDHSYDAYDDEPMTESEISDYGYEEEPRDYSKLQALMASEPVWED